MQLLIAVSFVRQSPNDKERLRRFCNFASTTNVCILNLTCFTTGFGNIWLRVSADAVPFKWTFNMQSMLSLELGKRFYSPRTTMIILCLPVLQFCHYYNNLSNNHRPLGSTTCSHNGGSRKSWVRSSSGSALWPHFCLSNTDILMYLYVDTLASDA